MTTLTATQLDDFNRDGYVVIRNLADDKHLQTMRETALAHLESQTQPIEYEADVAYPGAPAHRDAEGGNTPRRLLQAYDRDPAFADWARDPQLVRIMRQLLASDRVCMTRCHHNCVMTKHPGFSSATLWHQDLRYWSFDSDNLVNAWLALGDETPDNGCMRLLPGTHRMRVAGDRLDDAKFLRTDHPDNAGLIATACNATLRAGDVLFFHAGVFHAAGRNTTDQLKLSGVFTYHDAHTQALPDSRSARLPPVRL